MAFLPYPSRRWPAFLALVGVSLGIVMIAAPLLAAPQEPAPQPTPQAEPSPEPRQSPAPGAPDTSSEAAPPRPSGGARKILGRIRGTVFDPGKKPAAGLLVLLSAKDDRGLLRVTGTDENGQYLFQDLPAGLYDVQVTASGCGPQTKERIGVQPPFQNIVDFQLLTEGAAATKTSSLATLLRAARGVGATPAGPPLPGAAPLPAGAPLPVAAPAAPAGGNVTAPVRGTLVDARKKPLVEGSVTFVALEGSGIYQAFSGADGAFSLGSLPVGRYRALIASPGHVALDLKVVEVSQPAGLDLSLSLVDYPLNSKAREEDLVPRERSRPLPAASPTPGPSPTAAPSPAPPASTAPAAPAAPAAPPTAAPSPAPAPASTPSPSLAPGV